MEKINQIIEYIKSKRTAFEIILLILLLVLSGIIGVKLGLTVTLDFLNYHFYAPYAAIHNRIGIDILPCDIQSYFNPYLDYPFYVLVKYFNTHPNFILFVNSFYYGIFIFLVYKFADFVFKTNNLKKFVLIAITMVIAMTSPVLLNQINQLSNDTQIAIAVIIALFLIFAELFKKHSKKRTIYIAIAGLILGVITGLKFAAAIYCFSLFFTFLCMFKKIDKPIQTIAIFCISIIVGFFIVEAYWLQLIYLHFKNPVFPYFNNIFNSPFSDNTVVFDTDFEHLRATTVLEFLFYPFIDITQEFMRGTERNFYDLRYAISYICIPIIAIFINRAKEVMEKNYIIFLVLFVTSSYFLGILLFAQYRYLIVINSLTGILITLALYAIFKNKEIFIYICLVIITAFILIKTTYIDESRVRIHPSERLVDVKNMGIKDNAVVLLASRATSAFIVNQNPNAKYVYLAFPTKQKIRNTYFYDFVYYRSNYMDKILKELITANTDNLYLIYRNNFAERDGFMYEKALKSYTDNKYKELYDCKELENNLHNYPHLSYTICKIRILK